MITDRTCSGVLLIVFSFDDPVIDAVELPEVVSIKKTHPEVADELGDYLRGVGSHVSSRRIEDAANQHPIRRFQGGRAGVMESE